MHGTATAAHRFGRPASVAEHVSLPPAQHRLIGLAFAESEAWRCAATPGPHQMAVSALYSTDKLGLLWATPAGAGLRPLRTSSQGDAPYLYRSHHEQNSSRCRSPALLYPGPRLHSRPKAVTSVAEEKAFNGPPSGWPRPTNAIVVYMER